jgi:hypothetical protein
MATPKRPWTLRLLQLVDAGVTDRSELIERSVHHVPHGHAWRQRERDRAHSAQQTARRHPTRQIGPQQRCADDIYLIGARRVIVATLHSLVRNGALVRDGQSYSRPTNGAHVSRGAGMVET